MNITLHVKLRWISFCFLFILNIDATYAQNTKELDSLFGQLDKKGALNGCILIAENGKPIYEKAFGYADFQSKRMLNNESIFELASVSKQFTAMAIMQLHEKKKFNYNDDIKKFFPLIPYQGITVDNLLHHTSGIPDFLRWTENEVNVNQINYNKDILAAIINKKIPVDFKPGENLAYSNTNYVLLALIVEKISGLTFKDYLTKYIFNPLHMNSTQVYAQRVKGQPLENYAYGHIYNPSAGKFINSDGIAANRYQYYFDGVAGPYGISSSTADLLKWDQALYTDKLISKEEQMLAYAPSKLNNGKPSTLMGLSYGYGWLIIPKNEPTGIIYMHSGGYPGYMTIIARYPEKNKTIIILTNTYNVISLYQLCAAVEDIIFKQPFEIPDVLPFKKSVTLNQIQLNAIVGVYALKAAPQVKIMVTTDGSQAYAQLTGQVKVEIYPESELEFFYTVVTAKLKFEKDTNGVIKKLTLLQNGQQMEATKDENVK
jgi:CubicO group peptidase (beta-lactamase class C family)